MEQSVSSYWVVIGTLGGVLIMAVVNILTMILNNKYQMRRLSQTLLVNTAIETYKANIDFAKLLTEKGIGPLSLQPIVENLLVLSVMTKIFEGKSPTDKEIKRMLAEMKRVENVYEKEKATDDNEATK